MIPGIEDPCDPGELNERGAGTMEKRISLVHLFLFSTVFIFGLFVFPGTSRAFSPQIAAGGYHTVVLKEDGTLWAWGSNYHGQLGDGTMIHRHSPVKVGDDNDWTGVGAGEYHTVALKGDGSLWAWGYNESGQLGDGTRESKNEPFRVGTDNDWVAVTAGGWHTLALKSNRTLWAWGLNISGQLGDGTTVSKNTPVSIGTDQDWAVIAAGDSHTVAVKIGGTLWAWGNNGSGQLGIGPTDNKLIPTKVDSATDWFTAAAGEYHTLATKQDGSLWGWGDNYYGQLGDGTTEDRYSPVRIGADADGWGTSNTKGIAAGKDYTIALKRVGDSFTLCAWGRNNFGQLGDGTTTERHSPTVISAAADWVAIAAGGSHSVGVRLYGSTLWTWGNNVFGQLGDGTAGYKDLPTQIGTKNDWTSISARGESNVALRYYKSLWGWGNNQYGQLGDGTTVDRNLPVSITPDTVWRAIDAGFFQTVALRWDGTLWRWGFLTLSPVQLSADTDWTAVTSGAIFIVGLKADGTLWIWENFMESPDPVQVGTDHDWTAVSAGAYAVLLLKSDGSLWSLQVGEGLADSLTAPVRMGEDYDWAAISAGPLFSMALKLNGTLWLWYNPDLSSPQQIGLDTDWSSVFRTGAFCLVAKKLNGSLWALGENEYGQLGDGTTEDKNDWVQIGTGNDWAAIAAGGYHTVAIKTDGTLWGWGSNQYGELGDGTTPYKTVPQQVFALGYLNLSAPLDGQTFSGCSYYNLPGFSWDANETFIGFEVQFSSSSNFSPKLIKIKVAGTTTEVAIPSATWKKILLLPGTSGGMVYWRMLATLPNRSQMYSDTRTIVIEAAQAAGDPLIFPASKSSVPVLSWENACNKKFKVWFGNDISFTRKKTINFSVTNPIEDGGIFKSELSSSQWSGIRNLVGNASGATIYWKVESWDALSRHAQTDPISFVLTD
jgi:alpha-tubulin suppressor-like RCC1 family protein